MGLVFWMGLAIGQASGEPATQPETKPAPPIESPIQVVEPTTSTTEKGGNKKKLTKQEKKEADDLAKRQEEEAKKNALAKKEKDQRDSTALADEKAKAAKKLETILAAKPVNIDTLATEIKNARKPSPNDLTAAQELAKAWRNEKDNADDWKTNFWLALGLGLLGLLGLGIGWGVSQKSLKKKHSFDTLALTQTMNNNVARESRADLSKRDLEREIDDLKYELKKEKAANEELRKGGLKTEGGENPGHFSTVERNVPPSKINRYFNSPNPTDRAFHDQNGSNFIQPMASTYQLTLNSPDSDTANFQLLSSPETLRKILNTPETYIEPMCEATNAFNSQAQSIETKEQGLVKKRDGVWHLEKKAVIQYMA